VFGVTPSEEPAMQPIEAKVTDTIMLIARLICSFYPALIARDPHARPTPLHPHARRRQLQNLRGPQPFGCRGPRSGYTVFTHDLDFSAILATAGASGPSVLQVRALDVLPEAIGEDVVRVLVDHAPAIEAGAIVTLDELGARVRVLPIRRQAPRS
jgi:hypothetical protein